jgi:lipopolysaccharide transport system ATP-binding protein
MSEPPIIQARNIGKRYKLGQIGIRTLREEADRVWRKMRGLIPRTPEGSFWALSGVSFDVEEGEVLGIIGKNGAGKSTLLKVLSRITEPTEGEIVLDGRVGSLLEVGTGMHPELTGRENIYLNGTILGMKKREIDRKLDEIIDFSGIERHIDTPVKRYSSGQCVRLGFAVAAHLEPEILIVDEVLAVGDAEFQKKCIGKIKDVAGHGRTVLFVSHQMGSVLDLCTRCLWIDNGQIREEGSPNIIVGNYLRHWQGPAGEKVGLRSVDRKLVIEHVYTRDTAGKVSNTFRSGENLTIDIHYNALEPVESPYFSVAIQSKFGTAFQAHMLVDGHTTDLPEGPGRMQVTFPNLPLIPHQDYAVTLNALNQNNRVLVKTTEVVGFRSHGELDQLGLQGKASVNQLAAMPSVMIPYYWRLPDGTKREFQGFGQKGSTSNANPRVTAGS